MAGFVKAAKTQDVALGSGKRVEVSGKKIAIFNVDGKYFAIDDTCTHKGGPLSEGGLDGKEITCPWHGAVFDVTNGEVLGPPAPKPVSRYDVRISGNDIEVKV